LPQHPNCINQGVDPFSGHQGFLIQSFQVFTIPGFKKFFPPANHF